MPNKVSYIGESYGRLVVVSEADSKARLDGALTRKFVCLCECGNTKIIGLPNLLSGTRSCGCLNTERIKQQGSLAGAFIHGQASPGKRTSLYQKWSGLKQRCLNPKNKDFRHYGGRGIDVCFEWARSFEVFAAWVSAHLGKCPPGCSLDRIDNEDDYRPGNVRWATASQQILNQRKSPRSRVSVGYAR